MKNSSSRRRRAIAFVAGLALATTISAVAPVAASAQPAAARTSTVQAGTAAQHAGAKHSLLDWQW